MTNIKLPYGQGYLEAEIPDERVAGILVSDMHHYKPAETQVEIVRKAMENPIGTPRLREIAKGKKKVVVIASDHTRPVPSKVIMPLMLEEIRKGNPDADITILISTGCHRGTTEAELLSKFGPEIMASEKIYVHDCDDESMLVNIGTLPSGGELINKQACRRGGPSCFRRLHRTAFLRRLLRRQKERSSWNSQQEDCNVQP